MPFTTHKQVKLYAQTKSSGAPSVEQLALINQFTLREMGADELYTRGYIVAHNAIDRDGEVFDSSLLMRFAATLTGKGLFNKHPMSYDGDSGPGTGKWYSAKVITMSFDEARALLNEPDLVWPPDATQAELLEAGSYMPRSDKNKDLIMDIDAGVAGYVSIGFSATSRSDIMGQDNQVIARRIHAPGEALEASLVWLGAQPGARAIKGARQHSLFIDDYPNEEDLPMAMSDAEKKDFNDATTKAAAEKVRADEAEAKAKAANDELTTIKSAVCGDATKAGEVKASEVVVLVAAGKSFVDTMIDEIVTAKRHKKEVGDDAVEIADYKALYATYPIDMLKREHAAAIKHVPGMVSQLDGGEPNGPAGGGAGKKSLRNRDASRKAMGLDSKTA